MFLTVLLLIGACVCVILLAAGLIRAAANADRLAARNHNEQAPLDQLEFRAWQDLTRREEPHDGPNDTEI